MTQLEDMDLHEKPESKVRILPADWLPSGGSLKDLDLDQQLYNTYAQAKNYLDGIKDDESVPPNQVAQVMNTITAILKEIVKMQTDLYEAERIKKLEAAMIQAIRLAPKAAQKAFFEEYEAILRGQK